MKFYFLKKVVVLLFLGKKSLINKMIISFFFV